MKQWGICSEYNQIHSVVLSCPELDYSKIINPDDAMHYGSICCHKLQEEFDLYTNLLESLNVKVYRTDKELDFFPDEAYYNMIFSRDLAMVTREGIIISNMNFKVRKREPEKMLEFLERLHIPILSVIKGEGTFEGADALWVKEDTVLIGINSRTNKEGFAQINDILSRIGVKAIPVAVPSGIQHLLGIMNIIAKDRVLLRFGLADKKLCDILDSLGYEIIPLQETNEIMYKQAMNVVAVRSNEIIMPDDCPATADLYENYGIHVHKTPIHELRKGAGGLGCATLILERKESVHNGF